MHKVIGSSSSDDVMPAGGCVVVALQCFSTPTSQAVYYLPTAGDYYYYCTVFPLFWLNSQWNRSRVLPQRLQNFCSGTEVAKRGNSKWGSFPGLPMPVLRLAPVSSTGLFGQSEDAGDASDLKVLNGWLRAAISGSISWCASGDLHFKVINCSVCTASLCLV